MDTSIQNFGIVDWSATGTTYSDSIQVASADAREATLTAEFPGTLKDAVAAAPKLGSSSELLPSADLRLYKRSFTANADHVSATFTYSAFGDEFPKYTLEATPERVPLLEHRDFQKLSARDRAIAQEYINGGTDATAVYANASTNTLAQSIDDDQKKSGKWVKTTLGALADASSARAVVLARRGTKSIIGAKLVWTETKTTSSNNVPSRLGEKSSPRGDHPSGRQWTLSSYTASELARDTDTGARRYTVTTKWTASDAVPAE